MRNVIIALFFTCFCQAQNTYYVNNNGSSGNSGADDDNAWSLDHAISQATAGDTVWIRSGTYSNTSTRNFNNSGTSGNEINFFGYINTPGDIVSTLYAGHDNEEQTIAGRNFPTMSGNPSGGGTGWQINGNYINIRGIAFEYHAANVQLRGDNNTVDNCLFWRTPLSTGVYSSYGVNVYFDSANNTIKNNFIKDIEFGGIVVWEGGSNNTISGNYIVSDRLTANAPSTSNNNGFEGMDYYIATYDFNDTNLDTSSNIIENNWLRRLNDPDHQGHGIDIKGGTQNIVRNNIIENTNIELVFATCVDNEVYGNIITSPQSNGSHAHLQLRSGANNNEVWGNYIDSGNDRQNIWFSHANDGATSNSSIEVSEAGGNNNSIHHNVFVNGEQIIRVSNFSGSGTGDLQGTANHVYNNTFVAPEEGIRVYSNVDTAVNFDNNIIFNHSGSWLSVGGGSVTLTGSENNNFFGGSYSTASGLTGTLNVSPQFDGVGSNGLQYELLSSSLLIDAGVTIPTNYDFSNGTITGTPDIGAFEFGSTTGSNPTPPSNPVTSTNVIFIEH